MAPSIQPGSLEQAVYTWSSRNFNNVRGQGIAEVSPGLGGAVRWLESLDLSRFRPFAPGHTSEATGYPGWKELVTVGSMALGRHTVVYRKIASAGEDGAGRNRFVTQILVGAAADLSLAAIADDDACWLSAAECPLDKIPKLSPVDASALTPRTAAHDCAEVDAAARAMLEDLIADPGRPRSAADLGPPGPAALLLTAVPSALWSAIDLTWWVGPDGPVIAAGVGDQTLPQEAPAPATIERSQLHDCELHHEIEEVWGWLTGERRDWKNFAAAYSGRSGRKPPIASQVGDLPAASPRADLLALAASVSGEGDWGGEEAAPFNAQQALAFLKGVDRLAGTAPDLTSLLDPGEIRALFGEVADNSSLSRVARYLQETVPPRALEAAWRDTSLAALGLATLLNEDEEGRGGNWALPRRVDEGEMVKLCRYLLRSEAGIVQLGRLLGGGFAATATSRRRFVTALREGGAQRRHVFGEVLPAADLPAAVLADLVRENLDEFVAWCGISDPYAEALRAGLGQRRRRSWRLIPFFREAELR